MCSTAHGVHSAFFFVKMPVFKKHPKVFFGVQNHKLVSARPSPSSTEVDEAPQEAEAPVERPTPPPRRSCFLGGG